MTKSRFDYPVEFTTLPDYTAHAGQMVEVVRQLTDDECDVECQPMWLIRADDGWEGHACDGELHPFPPTEDLTPEGVQLVIPGTEKRLPATVKQGELW